MVTRSSPRLADDGASAPGYEQCCPGHDQVGFCPLRFELVRTAFEANFAAGLELGARFAVAIEGEIVILDGRLGRSVKTMPFGPDT